MLLVSGTTVSGRAASSVLYSIYEIKCYIFNSICQGTPTKRQVSKRQVSKRPVTKRPVTQRPKRQVYKTSGFLMSGFKTFFESAPLLNSLDFYYCKVTCARLCYYLRFIFTYCFSVFLSSALPCELGTLVN